MRFSRVKAKSLLGLTLLAATVLGMVFASLPVSQAAAESGKIVFYSQRDNSAGEIYTINADGSNVTRLTDNVFEDLYPAWSPDGAKIVFESARDGSNEIYLMNADGSGQV
ncbi:MAG TPA: hypothetical protein VM866_12445, partial [Pyrinomonadaceae bacterium]|nr:hypothetical protein [Pyrinomonadaceae bacterium]